MNYTISTIDQLKPILIGFRKLRKLSQKDIASKLGVSQQTYQVLETNPQKVTMDRLFRVLVILGVKLELVDTPQKTKEDKSHFESDHEGIW
ncbi:MAG: helix-turn-helix transcriptional regulator [Proteobacteria bacterium]|nr:helix-turn-helix transcriptional regulator [Pseudomonadota bacterium]